MSNTWTGFSEEDIKNLNNSNHSQIQDETNRRLIKAKRRTEKAPKYIQKTIQIHQEINDKQQQQINKTNEQQQQQCEQLLNESNEANNIVVANKKCIDLVEFQARQKLIESQNERRKELLSKALVDRTKRTEEEARKLKEIQIEFKKLDASLSNDVGILRHQIEMASLDFMEAQKRYERVEKDFLDAKLTLHQKLEKKEMLTEHLCAIIEKNEERKANKLDELMNRLAISDDQIIEEKDHNNQTDNLIQNDNNNEESNQNN